MEEGDCGMIECTVLIFAWRNWMKLWKPSIRITGNLTYLNQVPPEYMLPHQSAGSAHNVVSWFNSAFSSVQWDKLLGYCNIHTVTHIFVYLDGDHLWKLAASMTCDCIKHKKLTFILCNGLEVMQRARNSVSFLDCILDLSCSLSASMLRMSSSKVCLALSLGLTPSCLACCS
jgi:hypothetical protein